MCLLNPGYNTKSPAFRITINTLKGKKIAVLVSIIKMFILNMSRMVPTTHLE